MTMRSVVQTAPGDLRALDIVERQKPRPRPGEVLLRMKAAALNHRDLTYLRNDYAGYGSETFMQPVVPLSDGVGVVEEIGAQVSGLAVGDRVCTLFNQVWQSGPLLPEHMLGGLMPGPNFEGVLQDYICLPEAGVAHAPPHLSDAEAATLPCSALTAWTALRAVGAKRGDTVLISGTGGVAVAALQFAKAAGAKVVVTSSSQWKRERALAVGADAVFSNGDGPALIAGVRLLTNGRGADVSIEAGGGATLNASLECLKLDGKMALMGLLNGANADLYLPLLTAPRRSIFGINVGNRDDFLEMTAYVSESRMRPIVDRIYPFEQSQQAFIDYEQKNVFSKIVIAISA